jgi:hypothetical protein
MRVGKDFVVRPQHEGRGVEIEGLTIRQTHIPAKTDSDRESPGASLDRETLPPF